MASPGGVAACQRARTRDSSPTTARTVQASGCVCGGSKPGSAGNSGERLPSTLHRLRAGGLEQLPPTAPGGFPRTDASCGRSGVPAGTNLKLKWSGVLLRARKGAAVIANSQETVGVAVRPPHEAGNSPPSFAGAILVLTFARHGF